MRQINPDIVALIASGFSNAGDVRDILSEGAAGYLQKPFVPKELADTLSKILKRS
jgi:DNA-binding NarL/FixJ family response regulator